MLSIYIASLIALSSGMAVQQEASMPSKCYLFLYVRAAAKGWIRLTNDFLSLTALDPQGPESRTEFSKATEFVLPPNTNPGEFDTLRLYNSADTIVSMDYATQRSLTLQKITKTPDPRFFTPTWENPNRKDNIKIIPTELMLNNPTYKTVTNLLYCTSTDGATAILRTNIGDPNYSCEEAKVIVRFVPVAVDTFPQYAMIGVYDEASVNLIGWLFVDNSGYLLTRSGYDGAVAFVLTSDNNRISITLNNKVLGTSTSTDKDPLAQRSLGFFGSPGNAESFEWHQGNPHRIVPIKQRALILCSNANGQNYLLILNRDAQKPQQANCIDVMLLISAVKPFITK